MPQTMRALRCVPTRVAPQRAPARAWVELAGRPRAREMKTHSMAPRMAETHTPSSFAVGSVPGKSCVTP
jgi:hypothetical protein